MRLLRITWATFGPPLFYRFSSFNYPSNTSRDSTSVICYGASMAYDDAFIIGGRKSKTSVSSQGTPRTSTSRGGGSGYTLKLGKMPAENMSFAARVGKDLSIAKRSSGRKTYSKPSKARTGGFNALGRGRAAMASSVGPNRSWQTFDGSSIRYRSRRAVVKVRVMKLCGGKVRAAYMRGESVSWQWGHSRGRGGPSR